MPVTYNIEQVRQIDQEQNREVKHKQKVNLGQFMTSPSTAQFMANLFKNFSNHNYIQLLDAGAGHGALSNAFLKRYMLNNRGKKVNVHAYEIDHAFKNSLTNVFERYSAYPFFSYKILETDFIVDTVNTITMNSSKKFTHAILNPPYKKIHSQSKHRKLLHSINIEVVNLYSAFLALSIHLLAEEGELVAIIPRSFCNGSYYKSFRRRLLETSAIKQIHLFNSRKKVFKGDNVLQENVIIHLIKGSPQKDVLLSFSEDDNFSDYYSYISPFRSIVKENDDQFFIRIPLKGDGSSIYSADYFIETLSTIGIEVSTGPIVDFRLKKFLLSKPKAGSIPLLYPYHFENNQIVWPKAKNKKPVAIKITKETENLSWPNGFYVVVRRLSSKEEKHRIVASLVDPSLFKFPRIGFENHLNVFHINKSGLNESLAYGLMTFLNSSLVDECFRSFSGHTQVNATDLRALKYPTKKMLIYLGDWAKKQSNLSQQNIDKKIKEICNA